MKNRNVPWREKLSPRRGPPCYIAHHTMVVFLVLVASVFVDMDVLAAVAARTRGDASVDGQSINVIFTRVLLCSGWFLAGITSVFSAINIAACIQC